MGITNIQWTATYRSDGTILPGYTFNHVRGCTRVSEGCRFCYAETMSHRNPAVLGKWGPQGTRVVASESKWREPLAWDKKAKASGERHKVFCASLADVFEDWDGPMLDARGNVLYYNSAATWWVNGPTPHGPVPMRFVRERLFSLIGETPNLDWLVLTKRPENAERFFRGRPVMPNVWLGTSVEDQETADARIPVLLNTPAAVRFLSMEPLLGGVNLTPYIGAWCGHCGWVECEPGRINRDVATPFSSNNPCPVCGRPVSLSPRGIGWVIVGGESGSKARPCSLEWIRSVLHQCREAAVIPFVKQIGSNPYFVHRVPGPAVECYFNPGDSHGGDWSCWPVDLRVREVPEPLTGARPC